MDAIIISDIHLGSDVCQAKLLIEFLEKIDKEKIANKLIINGDLFDSWDFRRLKKYHWKVLSKIRKISGRIDVTLLLGNHDGPAEIISHLIGVNFLDQYILNSGDKKILILHGDIFDNFIEQYPLFTKIADYVYRFIQKIDKSFYLAKLAKKSSKTFLRCSEQIKEKAKFYCKKQNCDIVCCGHTHFAIEEESYCNSGSWTEIPCSYLSINNGSVKLCYFVSDSLSLNT